MRLINLSPFEQREVVLQAGTFGEHRFDSGSYAERTSDYPGDQTQYAALQLEATQREHSIGAKHVQVVLPPAHEIKLELLNGRKS